MYLWNGLGDGLSLGAHSLQCGPEPSRHGGPGLEPEGFSVIAPLPVVRLPKRGHRWKGVGKGFPSVLHTAVSAARPEVRGSSPACRD